MNAKLEIFILTCNRFPLLKQALLSALEQTVKPVRITVMDNASNDKTSEFMKSVVAGNEMVKYVRMPRHVPFSENVKAAISRISADYFILMHDDDVLSPFFTESVMTVLKGISSVTLLSVSQKVFSQELPRQESPETVQVEIYDSSMDFAASDIIRFFFDQRSSLCFPAVVYSRECVAKDGPNMSLYGKICDKPFVYRSMGEGTVVRILTPLYNYRVHENQDSANACNGPFPREILNFLDELRRMFVSDKGRRKVFYAFSVRIMKSLYFWGGNSREKWESFFSEAKSRGIVQCFCSRPWRLPLWRLWSDRVGKMFLRKNQPCIKTFELKGVAL